MSRYVAIHSQLPILSQILLSAKETSLSLSATNLELGIRAHVHAQVETEGTVAVPGKLFSEYISSLTGEKLLLQADKTHLEVKTDTSVAKFSLASPSDFPSFPSSSSPHVKLPLSQIHESILRVVFAASTDETRPVLTGVRVAVHPHRSDPKQSAIHFAATDGYRMSLEDVSLPSVIDPFHVILPARSLSELVRVVSDTGASDVGFSLIEQKNQIVFSLPQISLFSRILDGEFPSIEKVIPQTFKTRIRIETEHFAHAVKRVSLFARGAANIIRMKTGDQTITLSACASQIGSNESIVPAHIEGEAGDIAFNYRFLLDLLHNFPGDDIVFEMSGPLHPGVFKPLSHTPSFLHVIMPIRTQE